ncbi:MAG: 23S rRNA (adenine(2503)-C(2))-methyltransferase RlmN [Deinococcaceae bacterium]
MDKSTQKPLPLLLDLQPQDFPLEGYRKKQLLEWIYKKGAETFDAMTNLPLELRATLATQYTLHPFSAAQTHASRDGSVKYLFTLNDGKQMEAVYMPYADRRTICISTMVGCPAGCQFCATGRMGFGRNLTAGEMVGQVLYVARTQGIPPGDIRNLVFMGMGEPLLNYANTMDATRLLLSKAALGMSSRRVTLSTVGLAKGIRKMATEDVQVKLAISLHAPDEETRRRLIPTAAANEIEEIIEAAKSYQDLTGRRITFEYSMLKGINDHLWQADLLADRLKGLISHVNLIPMNPWPGSGFEESTEQDIQAFFDRLQWHGLDVSVRRSRGRDAGAACGQLALQVP